MLRRDPTPRDLQRHREWQQRAAQKYAQSARERAVKRQQDQPSTDTPVRPTDASQGRTRRRKSRRNDAQWRKDCEALYGSRCIVPGCGDPAIEMDHIKPRSQGGKSDVENGIPLCGAWSKTVPGGHHQMKTNGALKFDPDWLTPEQRTYLAKIGWVDWDEDGQPYGEGWRHFTERKRTDGR